MRFQVALLPLLAAFLALLVTEAGALPETPSVNSNGSIVLGQRFRSAGLRQGTAPRDYAAFLGVPFAQPPVGERRFKAPERTSMPPGVFMANQETPPCIQVSRTRGFNVIGREDCLTLQIFTPNFDQPTLDVLVLLHGGGFMYGQGPRIGLQFLMDYDMVVVNVDYRLGILGYLSFEDRELPGNLGMLDQVAALEWVKENIGHFGGNSSRVTLVGFSAGSASALMHTMSPLSKGLFQKVIAMSGSPLNPWAQQPTPRANAMRVATLANCTAANTTATLTCLRQKNATEILALESHFQDWYRHPFTAFAPVVDSMSAKPFLPESPAHLMKNRKAVMDVPILMSVTTEEGLFTAAEFITNNTILKELDDNWVDLAPKILHMHGDRLTNETRGPITQRIREHYLGNASLTTQQGQKDLIRLMTDRNFHAGIGDYALSIATSQQSPVYFYNFGYRGRHSLSVSETGGNTTNFGVSHADDFQYFIEFLHWSGEMVDMPDMEMRRRLLGIWHSFVNNSIPVVPGVSWQPLPKNSGRELHYLMISSPINMTETKGSDFGQSSFWKSLGIKENENHAGRASSSLLLTLASIIFITVVKHCRV